MQLPETTLKALKGLYSSDSAAKSILDHFAFRRERNPRNSVSDLGELVRELSTAGADTSRRDVSLVLRKLDDYGCGKYLTGRKGFRTRFEWKYPAIGIAKAAAGGAQAVEELRVGGTEDDDGCDSVANAPAGAREHTYQLRSGWEIRLILPDDLTEREAARLSEFVKTLPF